VLNESVFVIDTAHKSVLMKKGFQVYERTESNGDNRSKERKQELVLTCVGIRGQFGNEGLNGGQQHRLVTDFLFGRIVKIRRRGRRGQG
jgi:hypothetical protein